MALYARIENNKVAEIFETDGNIKDMFPDSFVWINVTEEKAQPGYGWSYIKGKFTAPVIDYVSMAEQERQYRLNVAIDAISIWQTKLLLGRLSNSDKVKLNSWLDYIDALNDVDITKAPDITWPDAPAI